MTGCPWRQRFTQVPRCQTKLWLQDPDLGGSLRDLPQALTNFSFGGLWWNQQRHWGTTLGVSQLPDLRQHFVTCKVNGQLKIWSITQLPDFDQPVPCYTTASPRKSGPCRERSSWRRWQLDGVGPWMWIDGLTWWLIRLTTFFGVGSLATKKNKQI